MPAVSYDTPACTVGCPDISPARGSTIQWTKDSRTVSSFTLSNFSPSNAFSQLPSVQNSWTGILNRSFLGAINYDVSVTPVDPGVCDPSTRQKKPKITVVVN